MELLPASKMIYSYICTSSVLMFQTELWLKTGNDKRKKMIGGGGGGWGGGGGRWGGGGRGGGGGGGKGQEAMSKHNYTKFYKYSWIQLLNSSQLNSCL
jgi:hypothetical protein